MSTWRTLPDVGYYQQLRDYVLAKDARARVIANPGTPATQDSSGGASASPSRTT